MVSPLTHQQLHEAELFCIKEAQGSLNDRLAYCKFRSLSWFQDEMTWLELVDESQKPLWRMIVTMQLYYPSIIGFPCFSHHNGVATTTACDYFGPSSWRSSALKQQSAVMFNTKAVHLELAVDCSTVEFLYVLRRFFSIRGQPAVMMSAEWNPIRWSPTWTQRDGCLLGQEGTSRIPRKKGMEWTFITRKGLTPKRRC